MGFWTIVSIPLNILGYFLSRKNFKNGEIYYTVKRFDKLKTIESVKVNAKAYLEAPKTVKFSCTIPIGTILISQYDNVKTQKEIVVRPENYRDYEQNYIPENIKTNSKYSNYDLFICQDHLGSKYEIIQSYEKKDITKKIKEKRIIKIGTRLKLYGGYDDCVWLCGYNFYKGTVLKTINADIKNNINLSELTSGRQVNLNPKSHLIVRLDSKIHYEEMTSDILKIGLRYTGSNWGGDIPGDDVIAVHLCPNTDHTNSNECKYIESNAIYEIIEDK